MDPSTQQELDTIVRENVTASVRANEPESESTDKSLVPPTVLVSPDPEITKVIGHAFQGGESIFAIAQAIFIAIPDSHKVEQLSDELLNLVTTNRN